MPQSATIPQRRTAAWHVEHVPELHGFEVQWERPAGQLIVSRGPHLYQCRPGEAPWHLGSVPQKFLPWLSNPWRPLQRATHAMFHNVIPLSGRVCFLSYGNDIYAMRDGIVRPLPGLAQRTRAVRGGVAVTARKSVYFGDYHANLPKKPSHIYRWEAGWAQAEVAYSFAKHTIRHIHGVFLNPYDQSLWCLTGDERGECRILRTDDGFASVEVIGAGDLTWKAISIQFTPTHAYYAVAAETMHNKIMQIDWRTGRRREVGEVNGPVNYSKAVGSDVFFAVMAKRCRSQKDGCATLWQLDGAGGLRKLAAFSKDRWPTRLFLPGSLRLATGSAEATDLWFTCVGVSGADNQTYRVSR